MENNKYVEEMNAKIAKAWTNGNKKLLAEIASEIEYAVFRQLGGAQKAIIEEALGELPED